MGDKIKTNGKLDFLITLSSLLAILVHQHCCHWSSSRSIKPQSHNWIHISEDQFKLEGAVCCVRQHHLIASNDSVFVARLNLLVVRNLSSHSRSTAGTHGK